MIVSHACNYALRTVLYLAARQEREFIPINEIARNLDISFHFLTKIFQSLTSGGITLSYRGPRGGISLARRADRITLADIVAVIDGREILVDCFLGLKKCTGSSTCPLYDRCKKVRHGLGDLLENMTVASLAQRASDGNVLESLFGPPRSLFATRTRSPHRPPAG